jgi:hypothetical protein
MPDGELEGPARRREVPGFLVEDLQPVFVNPEAYYDTRPSGPVVVSVIRKDGVIMGFLWADAHNGAGYLPAAETGATGINLGSSWVPLLHDSKQQGLTPHEALAAIVARGPSSIGEPGALGDPVPFEQLDALAWHQPPPPEPPARRG